MTTRISTLVLPGLFGSGPKHWQSRWQNLFSDFVRVEQDDWDQPVRDHWVARLEQVVSRTSAPIALLAHSLGCHTVAHWAAQSALTNKVVAAMLVSPPDLENLNRPKEVVGYESVPMQDLPFKSVVVASCNDHYASLQAQQCFAQAWGSDFVEAGALGHINEASDIGDWPEGQVIWRKLVSQ